MSESIIQSSSPTGEPPKHRRVFQLEVIEEQSEPLVKTALSAGKTTPNWPELFSNTLKSYYSAQTDIAVRQEVDEDGVCRIFVVNAAEVAPLPADQDIEEPDEFFVRIPPIAFLKTCVQLFWNVLRHPFKTTSIDLLTGQVVGRK